jgi:hypothetical protein
MTSAACTAIIVWAVIGASPQAEDHEILHKSFDALHKLTGKEYVSQRDVLLKLPGAVVGLAEIAAAKSQDEDSRWLAAILVERLRQPAEFNRLTNVWREKAAIFPTSFSRSQHTYWTTVIAAHEPFPALPVKPYSYRRNIEEHQLEREKRESEFLANYYKQKQLPKSPLWPLLFGEVVLKRLGPDALWDWQPEELPPMSQIDPQVPAFHDPRFAPKDPMTLEHCLCDAIEILASYRERRACREIERVAAAKDLSPLVRHTAVIALGSVGDQQTCDQLYQWMSDREFIARMRIPDVLVKLECPGALEKLHQFRDVPLFDPNSVSDHLTLQLINSAIGQLEQRRQK